MRLPFSRSRAAAPEAAVENPTPAEITRRRARRAAPYAAVGIAALLMGSGMGGSSAQGTIGNLDREKTSLTETVEDLETRLQAAEQKLEEERARSIALRQEFEGAAEAVAAETAAQVSSQTCPSKCSGVTRLARRVHRRSATMPSAAMELMMIGNIIQPPDLTNSHTVNVPSKKCATLPYRFADGARRPSPWLG